MSDDIKPPFDPRPPRLAVDAKGYVWRVYPEFWSMCPVNPDNRSIPEPVTLYEPQVAAAAPQIQTS